jgi:hypothetical protein
VIRIFVAEDTKTGIFKRKSRRRVALLLALLPACCCTIGLEGARNANLDRQPERQMTTGPSYAIWPIFVGEWRSVGPDRENT